MYVYYMGGNEMNEGIDWFHCFELSYTFEFLKRNF